MSNIVSIGVAMEKPLTRFEKHLEELADVYIMKPMYDVTKEFLKTAKENFSPEGMCILDGDYQCFGGTSCMTFICHEGALFPTPVPGVAFMTLEQIFEYPYDYEAIRNPSEFDKMATLYKEWYKGFSGSVDDDAVCGLSMLGIMLWRVLLAQGYSFVEYGKQQSSTQSNSYWNFYFVCQRYDVKFIVTIDQKVLVDHFNLLRQHAKVQNHPFV